MGLIPRDIALKEDDSMAARSQRPEQRVLTVHYRQGIGLDHAPTMHLWGSASDFVEDVTGTPQ